VLTAAKLEELGISPKVPPKRKNRIVEKGLWASTTLRDFLKNCAYNILACVR